jgi:hypothetical protein
MLVMVKLNTNNDDLKAQYEKKRKIFGVIACPDPCFTLNHFILKWKEVSLSQSFKSFYHQCLFLTTMLLRTYMLCDAFSFRFVFQIYQDFPNPNINYGLIVNETSTLTGTCAAWGSWDPPSLPPCIRKSFD